MRVHRLGYLVFSLVLLPGCKPTSTSQLPANTPQGSPEVNQPSASPANTQPNGPAEAAGIKPKVDACALLTTKEIEAVQGEAVKETKLTGQSAGGFSVSQCFFTLPTFNNSISLVVSQKGEGAGARDPGEFWRETFHESARERDREEKEEEGESTPPKRVPGLGKEAFWLGSRIGGSLHVIKGDSYVRISIGGPADQATKLAKSKALAQKALARL